MKINDISISYIIPTYNNCDITLQNVKKMLELVDENDEIIVIDDGSIDGTKSNFTSIKDKRLSFFENENNRGVSYSRNIGIINAKSEYVAFVDSDDYLIDEYFRNIKMLLVEASLPDLFKFDYIQSPYNIESRELKGYKEKISIFSSSNIFNSCWAQLIKRELIISNDIRFTEDISFGEDTLFTFLCLSKSVNVYMSNNKFYYYTENLEGLSKKNSESAIMNRITSIDKVYELIFSNSFSLEDSVKRELLSKKNQVVIDQAYKLSIYSYSSYRKNKNAIREFITFEKDQQFSIYSNSLKAKIIYNDFTILHLISIFIFRFKSVFKFRT